MREPQFYKTRTILDKLMLDVGMFPDRVAMPGDMIPSHFVWAHPRRAAALGRVPPPDRQPRDGPGRHRRGAAGVAEPRRQDAHRRSLAQPDRDPLDRARGGGAGRPVGPGLPVPAAHAQRRWPTTATSRITWRCRNARPCPIRCAGSRRPCRWRASAWAGAGVARRQASCEYTMKPWCRATWSYSSRPAVFVSRVCQYTRFAPASRARA